MDSRTYRFIYPLLTNADIPSDFPKEVRERSFEAGIFLPQDDSNWFTRPPQFPARLLLLEEQALSIIPHPTSGQGPVTISWRDLIQLETGYILLLGWMKFTTHNGVHELLYNTRASRPLEKFLSLLRQRWLRHDDTRHIEVSPVLVGEALDIKFRNLMHFEMDPEEKVIVQFFQPPVKTETKYFLLRRISCLPGHLLLLTSESRLLWITDDYRQTRELYAGISRSAPARVFRNCCLELVKEQLHLVLSFEADPVWYIPVRGSTEDALVFAQTLQEDITGLRTSQTVGNDGS
jgi:hypothetical protein